MGLVVFACLTLAVTYPLPTQMSTHLAGDDYDVWARPWATWWTKTALREGHSLYHTDLLYYPRGVSLVYHSFSHTNTAVALALEPLAGPVAAHNTTVLLAYLLSGFGMYALAKHITGSAGAGLVAGLIFTFSTYHVDQSSHLIVLSTQWIPLWALFVFRLVHEPRPSRHALPAALFLALTALSSWHLFLFSLLWLGLYLIYLLVWERARLNRSTLGALGLMGTVTLIAIGPLLLPLVIGQFDASVQEETLVPYRGENAIDLLAFFVPSRRHPLFGPWVEPLHERIGRRQVFLGYVTLALGLLGVVKGERHPLQAPAPPQSLPAPVPGASSGGHPALFWVLSTLVFFSMSLGPHIRFNGTLSERPLQPWLLPVVRFLRDPTRFTVMTTLGLAVLAALGVAWLIRRASGPARAWIVAGLCGLVLFEALPWPFPTTPVSIPPFYEQLRREQETFAVADIPVRQLELRRLSMFYQTVHQKPIVEGIVARTPSDAYRFIDQHPILSAFARGEEAPGNDVSRQLHALADAGVRVLVLHRRFLTAQQVRNWEAYLPYSPIYEDAQILVYRTRPVLEQDLQVQFTINDAIGLAHAQPDTRFPSHGETISLQAAWVAVQQPDRSYRVRWTLVAPTGTTVRAITGELSPGWPTEEWQRGDFGLGQYQIPADLPPGPYRLQVQLVDEDGHEDARDVGSVLVLPAEEAQPIGAGAAPVATIGDQIALTEMQIIPGDEMLHLHLTWQALRGIDRDYKLFAHLLDGEGRLVRQVDAMPRDWTAPTSTWHTDDVVSDVVSLDTYGLPAGTYSLSVGLYDPTSGERLPIQLPDGSPTPDASLEQEVNLP